MANVKRLLRQLPGFRTGRRWKQAIASATYGLVILTALRGGMGGVVLVVELLLGVLILADFKGVRGRIPLLRSGVWHRKMLGWGLLAVGGMVALDAAVPPVEPDIPLPVVDTPARISPTVAGTVPIDDFEGAGESDAVKPLAAAPERSTATPRISRGPTETAFPPTVETPTLPPPTPTHRPPTVVPTDPLPSRTVPPHPTGAPLAIPPAESQPGSVVISDIFYDGEEHRWEGDEYAEITNQGPAVVNLGGWRLNAGDDGQDFWFPGFDLAPGQSCRVYTDEVHPESCGFSYGRGAAIWNNDDPDCGYLFDVEGTLVSEYCY